MLPFVTEFPVKPLLKKGGFIGYLLSWLKGIPDSRVLDTKTELDIAGDNALMRDPTTHEELRVREFNLGTDFKAIGFRHDLPDNEGRTWRTEAVLRREAAEDGSDLLRLRTQCLATSPGALVERPRKPYLVKALLRDDWGATDHSLAVTDQAHWLDRNEQDMATAVAVISGKATTYLPALYVSAIAPGRWALSPREVENLAFDLGGIAHVVVEPDRAFSLDLRDRTDGANVYGGNIGLSLSGRGIVRRFHLGWQLQSPNDLSIALRTAVLNTRLQMPALGWEWTELQEQALRAQREREKNQLRDDEVEKLYQEEIENLRERVKQLELQSASLSVAALVDEDEKDLSLQAATAGRMPEIYAGEMSDRLRMAARETLANGDRIGLDARSRAVLKAFDDKIPPSPALDELLADLERASKDPKRIARELTSLLSRHGYREKADNKHIRLEAREGYDGLGAITLPKTPSESRGLKNLRKQIEGTLGLTKLK